MVKFIDLFAGLGGFHLALKDQDCVFASEMDKHVVKNYKLNFPNTRLEGDITKIDEKEIPEHDILCGGFPCQPFSIAGYRKGFEDERGNLFFDILRIVSHHKPKVIFLENVKNLKTHDNGNTYKVIKESLEEQGYYVFDKILNPKKHCNIAQNRERIFIVAFNKDKVKNYLDFKYPEEEPLTKTIFDFIHTEKQDDKYYYTEKFKHYEKLVREITKKDTIYQWRRNYVRENKSKVCPTLTAIMGDGGNNKPIIKDNFGIRVLTSKECFNFQGYPDDYKIDKTVLESKLYKQIGNSVCIPLVKKIADNILKIIDNN